MTPRTLTLRKIWECSAECEKDAPLVIVQTGDGQVRTFGECIVEDQNGKRTTYELRDAEAK